MRRFAQKALVAWFCAIAVSCASADHKRLKVARDAFVREDYRAAEAALYHEDVYKTEANRLLHYEYLASIAMSEGLFEKAILYLDRARTTAVNVRSDQGGFEFFKGDYSGNPLEFSNIHAMLVMAYSALASDGGSPAWSTPEMKDSDGNILVPSIQLGPRQFDAKQIAELRQKALAELRAWDSFLETLKRSNPAREYFHEDLLARLLASFVHGVSDQNHEKRTAELLADQGQGILDRTSAEFPSRQLQHDEIAKFVSRLKQRATSKKSRQSLLVVEAGVMDRYKIRRFHLGLSTLFSHIEDPFLRSQMESIGLQLILNYAPEFGLIAFAGGMAGAIEGSSGDEDSEFDGPPRFFTDAVDRSLGFEIRFPSLRMPPPETKLKASFFQNSQLMTEVSLPVVSPLQEMLAVELQKRQDRELFQRAIKVGLQYLAILIPAIRAYRDADGEGAGLQKLAILAGFYIAKKAIDRANAPDLRSWSTLPKLVAAQVLDLKPGVYDLKLTVENSQGRFEQTVPPVEVGNPAKPFVRRRLGQLDILKSRPALDPRPHF